MPLPSISSSVFMLFILQLCSVPNWAVAIQLLPSSCQRKNSQSNFHPFWPRLLFNKQHNYCTRTFDCLFQCYAVFVWSSNSQQRSRFSKHEESKNRRLSWCFLGGGEKASESKNRQLRLFPKHQRTEGFHERIGTEPVIRRAIFLKFFLKKI
jgi:hypothetical protein